MTCDGRARQKAMSLRRQFGAGIGDIEALHDSLHLLAHFLVWDAENCRVSHRRMCQPLSARRPSVDGLHAIYSEQPRPIRRVSPRRPITKSRLGDRGRSQQTLFCLLNVIGRWSSPPTRVVAEDAADEASIDWHHGGHNRSGNRAGLGAASRARDAAGTMGAPCPLSLQRPDPKGCVSSGADKPLGTRTAYRARTPSAARAKC